MLLLTFYATFATLFCAQLTVEAHEHGEDHTDPPYLIDTTDCLPKCDNKGGSCKTFCGTNGYCCRKGSGDCIELYEDVATATHYSCIKGIPKGFEHTHEHKEAHDFEKCKVSVLSGSKMLSENQVLGELDVLPNEFSLTFNFKPLVNETDYQLAFFAKDSPGLGARFEIKAHGNDYHLQFCGSMAGEYTGCTKYRNDYKVGDQVHVHIEQVTNQFGITVLKSYLDGVLMKTVTNMITETLKDVKIMIVALPLVANAAVVEDIYFGSCVSKFDPTKISAY